MKRASKILTLILIVVFVLSVFAGCDLIGKNVAKYRATTVMKVGEQEISIGKLLDTFNSYYNSYYYYVSAGYLTADSLLEMVMDSLIKQYIQIDAYVKDSKNVKTPDLKDVVKNAEFLTQEQFSYCIKYVKHTSFTTFDNTVLTNLSVKHDIADAEEEDTSRDFKEWDDLKDAKSFAEYLLNQNLESKDANEYFEKYYSGGSVDFSVDALDNLVADYVYTDLTDDYETILEELNDRLEDESDEITFEEYVEAQQKALDQYSDTIENNYGISLNEFMKGQVADMVSSCILALWSYEQYKDVGNDLEATLKDVDDTYFEDQKARFAINDDFDSFITSLSDSSYIYDVPQDMQGKYVFVKNILIPFSSQQSARLSAQASGYGGTDTDAYKKLRDQLATEIKAEYFYSDKYDNKSIENLLEEAKLLTKDEDGEYEKLSNLFTTGLNGIEINSDGALGQFLNGGEVVIPSDSGLTNSSDVIIELMKRFNTDTAQHKSRYDYVVYVGKDWEDYSHSWVKEFYTAVNEMKRDGDNFSEDNIGHYTMCISTYGVHIIYIDSFVESKVYEYDWSVADAWKATETLNYARYSEVFQSKVSQFTDKALDKLVKDYFDNDLVEFSKEFKRFLKDNDFTFDFDEYKEETLEELNID